MSPGTFPDMDAVTSLIAEVSAGILLPRFRSLGADDICPKPAAGDLEDIVTTVDREAETALSRGLAEIYPAAVIGEEAAALDPSLVARLGDTDPLWVVDPLDGTRNFVAGNDGFGVMVSFVRRGHVRAAWIHLPARRECFVAQAGSGTFCNGERVRVASAPVPAAPKGALFVRFMTNDTRESLLQRMSGRFEPSPQCGAAAVEYTDVLRGRKDFVIYYRLLPWDHGAPALVLTEGGGVVEHLDGRTYSVCSPNQVTIAARCADIPRRVRAWVESRD